MEIVFLGKSESDLFFWKKSGNKNIQKRIEQLLKSILQTPYEGIGKPEPLKYNLTGLWSRRITEADRLVYEVIDDKICIYSLKGHYEK